MTKIEDNKNKGHLIEIISYVKHSKVYLFITKKVLPVLTVLTNISFWTVVAIFASLHLHWAHIVPIMSDFDIEKSYSNPPDGTYYSINDTFKITFILSNSWDEAIDAEFGFIHDPCINAKYSCHDNPNGDCEKAPPLTKEFIFKNINKDDTKYIVVEGIFTDTCREDLKICLSVDEPKKISNKKEECFNFSPSQLKR